MGLAPFNSYLSNDLTAPPIGQLPAFGAQPSQMLQPYLAPQSNQNDFVTPFQHQTGNSFTGQFGQGYDQSAYAQPAQSTPGTYGGLVSNVGGAWAALDQHNNEIANSAAKTGVPANLIKAMVNRESSGNWARDNRVYGGFRNDQILPFVGIFRKAADSWGLNFDAMIGNKQAQIDGMATIIKGLADQYGSFDKAALAYFGGDAAVNGGGFTDELGMDSGTYGSTAVKDWKYLDQAGGYTGGYGNQPAGNVPQAQRSSFLDTFHKYLMKG